MMIMFSDGELSPRNWSVRVFLISFYFFVIIIATSYLANLVVALQNHSPSFVINSAQDLANRGLPFCVQEGTYSIYYLSQVTDSLTERLDSLKIMKPSIEECIAALRDSEVSAVMGLSAVLQYYASDLPCDLRIAGPAFAQTFWSLATRQNFTYQLTFDYYIAYLHQIGLLSESLSAWTSADSCSYNPQDFFDPITIPKLAGLWYILLIGLGVALLLLIIEWLLWLTREHPQLQRIRTFFGDRRLAKARQLHAERTD
jgi:subtilase family serine protease